MRNVLMVTALFLISATISASTFEELFLDRTMRVNYFHTGGKVAEVIALESVVSDGVWPGSRTRLIDASNLGNYLFEVIDRETNLPIYSRGFASHPNHFRRRHDSQFSDSVSFSLHALHGGSLFDELDS